MIRVIGKGSISATIIQDSINKFGKRIITYELEYHRYIHAEFMTHRLFSRNAASSRAIPVDKMHQNILDKPATPIVWQKNQAGMQSNVSLEGSELKKAMDCWEYAIKDAIYCSKSLLEAGLHKQWANRPTEAFQMMKTVMTTTEEANWVELRNHTDAQPEIHELARCMLEAKEISKPFILQQDEWHVPYVERTRDHLNGPVVYRDSTGCALSAESAIMISASCCAQVSYRKSDDTYSKAQAIFDKLIKSKPQHASPIEHQATPMREDVAVFNFNPIGWEKGVTHVNKYGQFGSGNFYGWVQYRQLL